MANKIGFRHYDDDKSTNNSDKSTSNDEVKQTEITDKVLFRQFIEGKYQPFGSIDEKVFKSSRDLAYEAREFCSPSLPDIAAVMKELGYTYDGFLEYYAWVLYDKEPLRY